VAGGQSTDAADSSRRQRVVVQLRLPGEETTDHLPPYDLMPPGLGSNRLPGAAIDVRGAASEPGAAPDTGRMQAFCGAPVPGAAGAGELIVRSENHAMTKEQMSAILSMRLAAFRTWAYSSLATRVENDSRNGDCLDHVEGVSLDRTPYQMEFNAFWDDRPHGDIRVSGSLSAEPQRRFLGFLPIYMPHVTDSFIMRPDGSFVDEG
jgi:hypothetical protein